MASADPTTVTSYDILSTYPSGYGAWHHTYSGTMTITGTFPPFGAHTDLYDYINGSGTLNDGLLGGHVDGIGIVDTHLFANSVLDSLTIYLDDYYNPQFHIYA
jgi:hypothetical protein